MSEGVIQDRSVKLAVRVVNLARTLHAKGGVARLMAGQVLRAGTSVGANVAEAQAGQSRADFIAKMSIAQKESRETLYWLTVLNEAGVVPPSRLAPLRDEVEQVTRILAKILVTTKQHKA